MAPSDPKREGRSPRQPTEPRRRYRKPSFRVERLPDRVSLGCGKSFLDPEIPCIEQPANS